MAKVYKKGRTRKHINQKRVLNGKRQGKTGKEIKKKRKEAEKLKQEKRREDTYFSGEGDFKKGCFKKIGLYPKEKVIDKRPYTNKKTLIEVTYGKNKKNTNKKHPNKKFHFSNYFKYGKGKILLYYINIIILMILNLPIKTISYIELTITGPGISSLFYENPQGDNRNTYCPNTIFPTKVYINNIPHVNPKSEYYLNNSENIIRLEYDNNTNIINFNCYFYLCSNITKIDFTHFNFITSSKYRMAALFCK